MAAPCHGDKDSLLATMLMLLLLNMLLRRRCCLMSFTLREADSINMSR